MFDCVRQLVRICVELLDFDKNFPTQSKRVNHRSLLQRLIIQAPDLQCCTSQLFSTGYRVSLSWYEGILFLQITHSRRSHSQQRSF